MNVVFWWLGILDGCMGLVTLGFTGVARKLLDAMCHKTLADKYALDGRSEESASEESDYEAKTLSAATLWRCIGCVYAVTSSGLVIMWASGFIKCASLRALQCGRVPWVFIGMFVLNMVTFCISTAGGRSFCTS
eukprot:UN2621